MKDLLLFDYVVLTHFLVLNTVLLFLMMIAVRAVSRSGPRMNATEAAEREEHALHDGVPRWGARE